MQDIQLTRIPCPLCGSESSAELFKVRDYALKVSKQLFTLRSCLDCGVGYLSPRPREEDMALFYPESFYWMHEGGREKLSGDRLLALRHEQLQAKADCLAHLSPGRLLDIGAQKGDFLYWMSRLGWQPEGVEYSKLPPNLFHMPIRYGEFLEMEWTDDLFDCVTMWAVLEHVYNPGLYIEKVSRLMKNGGKFIGLVTNLDSLQARFLKMDDYPRHLTVFTQGSLEQVLSRNGFRLDRCWTDQKIFGGSMLGGITYATKRLFGYSDDEVLAEWKDPDAGRAFCCQWHGRQSWLIRQISRLDRLSMKIPDKICDRLGRGFILIWEATYVGRDYV